MPLHFQESNMVNDSQYILRENNDQLENVAYCEDCGWSGLVMDCDTCQLPRVQDQWLVARN